MADYEEFKFVIPAFTPETMPLDRLLEYLQQIAAVIGDASQLHLIKIEQSSTAPVFKMDTRVAYEAKDRADRFRSGQGTTNQHRAYDRLRRMVRHDTGQSGRPARLHWRSNVVIEIPPAPDETALSGIRQATTLDGLLVSVGGVGDSAAIRLQSLDGTVVSKLSAERSVAKELARRIYEPVRVSGPGTWGRSEDGVWGLERMQIQSFEPLDDEPLSAVMAKLRAAKVNWPDDAEDRLMVERGAAE